MIHWLAVAALIFAAVYEKDAEATTVGSISVLYGDEYATGEPSRMTTRFDVLAIKDWGMVYGRADISSFAGASSNVFTRGIGHYGKGLHLAGQLQNQKGVSQSSVGFGYSEFARDSSWFVDVYRASSNYYGDSSHAFAYGSKKFDKIKLSGFIERVVPERELSTVTFSQIALSYELLPSLYAGVEHQRYFNKNGVKGLDESVNQVMVKWEF